MFDEINNGIFQLPSVTARLQVIERRLSSRDHFGEDEGVVRLWGSNEEEVHVTTLCSFVTAAESTMEQDPSHHHRQNQPKQNSSTGDSTTTTDSEGEVVDGGDPKVWTEFNKSFEQVQSVLDRNRVLIKQVNENQESRVPDNMTKNVNLIQELNLNMSKVVSLYSHLNSNFSNACNQQHSNSNNNNSTN
ncbi:hypothetical protein RIF29_17535 [Crotalaria pallida]|uniref:Protein EARLY FLOWERING 4 domain-containing protein n=1 Tax=Crotalaria pallida TaxID=3830 RepID=A0AAN9FJI2_CROPI